jgi:serine/threonine protein kinase
MDAQLIGQRYQVLERLGHGGMGVVYLGRDTKVDTPVAIKRLHENITSDSQLLERFHREGNALRELNHPNIVKVFDMISHEGSDYLVMEYVESGSLDAIIRQKERLPLEQALKIALELSDALTRAHHLGIIHRDLKPANVLIAGDGTARLTDFGIALISHQARLTDQGASLGTLDYMSPEAIEGEVVDSRTDIWGFGILLYEMLAGERPFRGQTTFAVLNSIINDPVPDLRQPCPEAPATLVGLIEQMLTKDRSARTRSMRIVGGALEAILQGEPLPAALPTPTPRPRTTPQPKPQVADLPDEPTQIYSPTGSLTPQRRIPRWAFVAALLLIVSVAGFASFPLWGGIIAPPPTPTATPLPTIAVDQDAPRGYRWVSVDEMRFLVPSTAIYQDLPSLIEFAGETVWRDGQEAELNAALSLFERQRTIAVYFNWLALNGIVLMVEDTQMRLSQDALIDRINSINDQTGYQTREVTSVTVNGDQALRFDVMSGDSDFDTQAQIYAIQRGSTLYLLIFGGNRENMADMQPDIDTTLASFQIVEDAP